jgi:dTDP-4-dehydrorhamnose reductase
LLLGKKGMLGSCFLKHLAGSEDFEMYATDKDELDITSFEELETIFDRISPDIVLNCAAYTAVDDCEDEANKELAFRLNAEAAGVIARVCKKNNAVLVHFSTDYVFDGIKSDGYAESDAVDPINTYGSSKLKGEELISTNMDDFYIIRTSWLFGENGKNFVDTMIRLGKESDQLRVVGDQIGSPTYTADLVKAVIRNFVKPYLVNIPQHHEKTMSQGKDQVAEHLSFGIYHLTNDGTCSWYDFAREIFKLRDLEVEVEEVNSEEFGMAAKRPKFSILLNTKLPKLRNWREALKAYIG